MAITEIAEPTLNGPFVAGEDSSGNKVMMAALVTGTITLIAEPTLNGPFVCGVDAEGRKVMLVGLHPESATPGGSGVTSVGLALPSSVFAVSGSPVTGTGTLTGAFNTQTANQAFMGPANGAAAAPTFRTLVNADIPTNLDGVTLGATTPAAGTFTTASASFFRAADGLAGSPSYSFTGESTSGLFRNATADLIMSVASTNYTRWVANGFTLNTGLTLGWGSTSVSAPDLLLARDGVGVLGQRNGLNAQTWRLYNTFTSLSNAEWLQIDWTTVANNLRIGTNSAGAGGARSLTLASAAVLQLSAVGAVQIAPGGTGSTWLFDTASGNYAFRAVADLAVDIGRAAFRLKNIFVAAALVLGSQVITAAVTLTSASPYRTIGNSATPFTQALPASPLADETRVFDNVGAGTMTLSYTGRAGATTRALAQDASVTMAYNATLGYWTTE